MHSLLLLCGVASALVYVVTDITAGLAYPGYDFADQAVSELFAIGAPTSRPVALLFSVSSLLLIGFAYGVWTSAARSKRVRLLATMFASSALVGLVLWNIFPMHMRGASKTLTDTMHLIFATNPFVVLTLVTGMIAFGGWFRWFTLATTLGMVVLAILAFRHGVALGADLPTPGLGLNERASQYSYLLWQVGLSMFLLWQRGAASQELK
jgi:hydrogenase/urease accessory protein HupE